MQCVVLVEIARELCLLRTNRSAVDRLLEYLPPLRQRASVLGESERRRRMPYMRASLDCPSICVAR